MNKEDFYEYLSPDEVTIGNLQKEIEESDIHSIKLNNIICLLESDVADLKKEIERLNKIITEMGD